jgi:hypothetical protein
MLNLKTIKLLLIFCVILLLLLLIINGVNKCYNDFIMYLFTRRKVYMYDSDYTALNVDIILLYTKLDQYISTYNIHYIIKTHAQLIECYLFYSIKESNSAYKVASYEYEKAISYIKCRAPIVRHFSRRDTIPTIEYFYRNYTKLLRFFPFLKHLLFNDHGILKYLFHGLILIIGFL